VFASQVKDALKQWRFKPTNQEYKLTVTVKFEFNDDAECNGGGAITPETHVSADLPIMGHVTTSLPCTVVQSNKVR
jgi:hypothetical protein